MQLNDYQKHAISTARSVDAKDELFHLLLGLCGESGEIAEKMKKIVRDQDGDFTKVDVGDLKKELGDVLWHVAAIANYFNIELNDVGQTNVDKLASRKARGVLHGSGDNR